VQSRLRPILYYIKKNTWLGILHFPQRKIRHVLRHMSDILAGDVPNDHVQLKPLQRLLPVLLNVTNFPEESLSDTLPPFERKTRNCKNITLQFRGTQNTALFYPYVLLILSSEQLLYPCSKKQSMQTRVMSAASQRVNILQMSVSNRRHESHTEANCTWTIEPTTLHRAEFVLRS